MEKNDYNQEKEQDQSLVPPKEIKDSTNQEATYWESSTWNGEQIQPIEPKTSDSASPTPQSDMSENTSVFEQYLNQPSLEQTPYYQTVSSTLGKAKNHSYGRLIALAIIIFLLVGIGSAYAFRSTLANTLAKMSKDSVDYYTYVEKKNIEKSLHQLTSHTKESSIAYPYTYEVNTDVTINKPVVDSLLQSSFNTSLSDLETTLGLPLDRLGFKGIVGSDGDSMNESISISLNQVELITADLFFDLVAKEILLHLPDLSNAYLSIDDDDFNTLSKSTLEPLDIERMADLLRKYSDIAINQIQQVTLEDSATISVGSKSKNSSRLTVTLTEQDLINILTEVLTKAKDEGFILDLLPNLQLTKEEYQLQIEQTLLSLQAINPNQTDAALQMVVYVDNMGNIIGRELIPSNSNVAFGYMLLTEGAQCEYTVYLKEDSGATLFEVNGKQRKDHDSYSGTASLVYSGTSDVYSGTSDVPSLISMDISYEDLHTKRKDGIQYVYGSVNLSSLELMGLQVMATFDVIDGQQYNKLVLQLGSEPLLTFDTRIKHTKSYQPSVPSSEAKIYDFKELEAFTATFDLEGYLTKLSEQLGVDLQNIMEQYRVY